MSDESDTYELEGTLENARYWHKEAVRHATEVERLRNERDEMYHLEREANEDLRAEAERLREALKADQDAAIAVIDCWRKFYRFGTTKKSDVDGWIENLAGKWIATRATLKEEAE